MHSDAAAPSMVYKDTAQSNFWYQRKELDSRSLVEAGAGQSPRELQTHATFPVQKPVVHELDSNALKS